MTNKHDFESLTQKINARLEQTKAKLENTSKNAESGFIATKAVVENFIAASAQKLEADKSIVANQVSLTGGFFNAMQSIGNTFNSVHESLAKIGSALSSNTDHQLDFVGNVGSSMQSIDVSDQ